MTGYSKRVIVALAVVACVTSLPTASAHTEVGPQTQEQSYDRPHGVWTSHYDEGLRGLPEEPLTFEVPKRANFVTFRFDDVLGTAVLAYMRQGEPHHISSNPLEDHAYSNGEIVCAREHSYRLTNKKPIEVRIYSGLCPNHTFGYALSGTVTASFSRR